MSRILLFAFIVSIAPLGYSAPLISIGSPQSVYFDAATITYSVFSPNPIASVEAFIDGQPIETWYDPMVEQQSLEFSMPATTVSGSSHTVSIKATDIFFESTTTTGNFQSYSPLITVVSPRPYSFGTPRIHVEAISQGNRLTVGSVTRTNSISLDLAISGSNKISIRAVELNFPGRVQTVSIPVFGATNKALYPEVVVSGRLLDFDGQRFLYESNSVIHVSDEFGNVTIRGPLVRSTTQIVAGFLTPFGATYQQRNAEIADRVFELDANGSTFVAVGASLRKRGNWAVFVTPGKACFLRDLTSRTSKLVGEDLAGDFADVSTAGDYVYWRGESRGSGSVYLNGNRIDDGSYPLVDSGVMIYSKDDGNKSAIFTRDSSGIRQLCAFGRYDYLTMPDRDYRVTGGAIAYITSDGIIVKRTSSGISSIVDPGYTVLPRLLGLNAEGDVIWEDGNELGSLNPQGHLVFPGTIGFVGFNGQWVFQNGRWQVMGGPVLFSVFGPSLKARIEDGLVVISTWAGSPTTLYSKTIISDQWRPADTPFSQAGSQFEYRILPTEAEHFFAR